jgi:hypothetical protein
MLGALALAFPFAMIGLFEGGYNHVLKNVLYFGGATRDLLQALFPAPTYELPNNLLFELSGIAQFPPAVAGIGHLIAMVRGLPERQGPTLVAPIV